MRYFYQQLSSVPILVHAFPGRLTTNQQAHGNFVYLAGYRPDLAGGVGHVNVIKHTNFATHPDGSQVGDSMDGYETMDWYWEGLEDEENGEDEEHDHADNMFTLAHPAGPPLDATNPENPEHDFPQRYRETYVLAHSSLGLLGPVPIVVFVYGSGGHGANHNVVCSSPNQSARKNVEIPYEAFKVIKGIPSNKFVNSEAGNVLYYSRLAERQWRRGVCDATFRVDNMSKVDKEKIKAALKGTAFSIKSSENTKNPMLYLSSGSDYHFTMANMIQLFQPKYPTYLEAFESIISGKRYATAFGEQLFLTASPKTKNLLFGIGDNDIAEVDISNPNSVIVGESLLYQEILDLVKRQILPNVKVTKA